MKLLLACLFVLCIGSALQEAWSANQFGTIKGRVLDPSGRPVSGASVYYERFTRRGSQKLYAPTTARHDQAISDRKGRFAMRVYKNEDEGIEVLAHKESAFYADAFWGGLK